MSLPSEAREKLIEMRELAATQLEPIAAAGRTGRVNRPLIKALAEHGVLPSIFPAASATTLCAIREGLAQGCTEAETAFALQGLGSYPIVLFGSDEQRDRWLPSVAAGDAVAAFALTEASGGSDAGHLGLTAERADGGYRLSGSKKWISNAPDADVYTVFARTTPEAG